MTKGKVLETLKEMFIGRFGANKEVNMKNKLFRIRINTYYFGNRSYWVYVIAENSEEALQFIYKEPFYKHDEDAEIGEIVEITFETKGVVWKITK